MQHRQPTANAQGNGLDNGGGEFLGGKRPTEGAGSNPFDGEWEATPAVAAVPGLGPMVSVEFFSQGRGELVYCAILNMK